MPRPNLKNLLTTLRQAGVRVYTGKDVHIEFGGSAPTAPAGAKKKPPRRDALDLVLDPPDFDPDDVEGDEADA